MAGLEQNQHLKHAMQQSMVLSPRQQLGLDVLAMPQLTLADAVQMEISSNPFLEEGVAENFSDEPADVHADYTADSDDYEEGFEAILARQDSWVTQLPFPESEEDRKQAFLSNSPAPGPSLRDLLLDEAENADIPERLKIPVFEIISSLDPHGFLTVPLVDLVMSCALCAPDDMEYETADLEKALQIVRALVPPDIWIGRRSDFFKQQLERSGRLTPEFSRLCDELEQLPDGVSGNELKERFLPQLAAKLAISPDELENMLSVLQEFKINHLPEFEAADNPVIYPDLEIIELPDGRFTVNVLHENNRPVVFSDRYEKMLEGKKLLPEEKKLVNEKIARAKDFIQALAMRESTLKRLGDLIVERQKDFLTNGIAGLKSFTMSEAASLLGFNASTVTRAVEDKYVRTSRGLLPLRFFFPGTAGKSGANERSREAVMDEIRKIIDQENPALPLSDDRIAEMLKDQGIAIERRTVAKYRTALNIPGASGRKKFR